MNAAQRGDLRAVTAELDHGADLAARDEDGLTALHWAVLGMGHDQVPVVKLLLERGADVNAGLGEIDTPLHRSVFYATPEVWEMLLEHGAKIDAKNIYKLTPLHFAASFGRAEAIIWLREHGAPVNDMFLAAATNNTQRICELLAEGQGVNGHDWQGRTVLDWARNNEAKQAEALLECLGAKTGPVALAAAGKGTEPES